MGGATVHAWLFACPHFLSLFSPVMAFHQDVPRGHCHWDRGFSDCGLVTNYTAGSIQH